MFKTVLRSSLCHKYFLAFLKDKLRSYISKNKNVLFTELPKSSGQATNTERNVRYKNEINILSVLSKLQSESTVRSRCDLQVTNHLESQCTTSPQCGFRTFVNQRSAKEAMSVAQMATALVGARSFLCLITPQIPKTQIMRHLHTTIVAENRGDRPWERCVGRGAVRRPEPKEVPKPRPEPPPPCGPHREPCKYDPDAFMDVKCKRAIVTGGGTGIGLATCSQLLAEGADCVMVVDRDVKAGRRAVRSLVSRYGKSKAVFAKADATCMGDLECVFKAACGLFETLDILVNNVGACDERYWQYTINSNVKSVMCGCCLAMKYMSVEHGGLGGVVLNVSSASAWDTIASLPIFCSTKRAVIGLTESFGHEARYALSQVRVVSVCPGLTKTNHLRASAECHLDPEWAPETKQQLARHSTQPASAVGGAITYLVRYGVPATHYAVEGSVISQLLVPSRAKCGKHLATFL